MADNIRAVDIIETTPSQLLDSKVSDEYIARLAFDMENWEMCAPLLGLSQEEVEDIKADHEGLALQSKKSLLRWKEIFALDATYKRLITILCMAKMSSLAKKLRRLLLRLPDDPDCCLKCDVLDDFRSYLQDMYTASVRHPSRTQWPFSALDSYVDLSLFDADVVPKSMGEEMQMKPINLEDLFRAGNRLAKRKVVLLEGVAGSGKTTISWHSCKEWAAGKLFQHIRLLIHVSLNDPEIVSAQSLADIIPHPDEEMRAEVAKAIQKENGKGVCFLFDASDEAPESMWHRQGFLYRFIEGKGRSSLRHCSIVMTARPEIHHRLHLSPLLTAHIHTKGFESSKLEEFLDVSLSEDPELRKQVSETFMVNPKLVGLCSLPINAVILVHLYHLVRDNLPTTTTGLFKPLVCNFLIRHIEHKDNQCPEIKEFSDLPPDISLKFNAVCQLAFSVLMKRNRIFTEDMMKDCGVSKPADAMGMLELHLQLTAFGLNRQYSFLHLSLQEFLTAVHVTQMSEEEQAATVQQILQMNPLSPVLPFYAGLTKLSNRAALDVLLEVTKKSLDLRTIVADMVENPTLSGDRRRAFLALLNCIYESQESRLCELVDPPATIPDSNTKELSLGALRLYPVDYLSVGFFLSSTSFKQFSLYMYVGDDTGLNALIEQLGVQQSPTVQLGITVSNVTAKISKLLKKLVQCVLMLRLEIMPGGTYYPTDVLQSITEGVYRCSTPRGLWLRNYYPSLLNYLVLLLSCQKLFELYARGMKFNSVMAQAVKVSTLNKLSLPDCDIDDDGLKHLVHALQDHSYLGTIAIPLSSHALTFLLHQLIGGSSVLRHLIVFTDTNSKLNEEQESMLNEINRERSRLTLEVAFMPKSELEEIRKEGRRHMFAISQMNPELMYRV